MYIHIVPCLLFLKMCACVYVYVVYECMGVCMSVCVCVHV